MSGIGDRVAESWRDTLEVNAAFDRPWVEQAISWALGDEGRAATTVVDVGCGAGGAACAFAGHLPAATVLALDRDPRLLAVAARRAAEEAVGARVRLTAAAVGRLPLRPATADVVWASGVVHHLPDQQAALHDLTALLRPAGRLVLVEGGLPLRCLPHEIGLGRPGLEARLDEARARWFADLRAELGGPPLPYGWPAALARAGLTGVRSRSFLAEATPPLDAVGRQIALQHVTAALTELGDRLAADDRAVLTRLTDPHDPAWLGARDDVVVTAVRTVHTGVAPG